MFMAFISAIYCLTKGTTQLWRSPFQQQGRSEPDEAKLQMQCCTATAQNLKSMAFMLEKKFVTFWLRKRWRTPLWVLSRFQIKITRCATNVYQPVFLKHMGSYYNVHPCVYTSNCGEDKIFYVHCAQYVDIAHNIAHRMFLKYRTWFMAAWDLWGILGGRVLQQKPGRGSHFFAE